MTDSCRFSAVSRLETACFGGHGDYPCPWKKKRSDGHAFNLSFSRARIDRCFGCLLRVGHEACRAYEPLRKGSRESGSGKGFKEPGLREGSMDGDASEVLEWRRQGVEEVDSKQKSKEVGLESIDFEMDQNYPSRKSKRADADLTGFEEREGAEENDIESSDMKISKVGGSGGKLVMNRSNMLAKQVISMQSALSLGFVSQLWVDTRLWEVLLVEVRPNLLSGEMERFFLEDIYQVGDVILVPDESVMENDEMNIIGLDTLVGYSVITQDRQRVGKVRGFRFNVNSGVVESLEIDSYGMSIIPSSLVSTYGLLAEDVAEVAFDTVVIYSGAVSRLQRLTKGFWDSRNGGFKTGLEEYPDSRNQHRMRRNIRSSKFRNQTNNIDEDWELPMEF